MTKDGSRLSRKLKRRETGRRGIQLGGIIGEIVRGGTMVEIAGTEIGDPMEAGQVEVMADPVTGMGRLVEMWLETVV